MDLEDQWKIDRLICAHGCDSLAVILGCPDAESSQIQAETVSVGDPSMAGPLTDKFSSLPVVHVAEPLGKRIFHTKIYIHYVSHYLRRIDCTAIQHRMDEVRAMVSRYNREYLSLYSTL